MHQHIASVLVLYLAGMMSSDKPSSSTTALYDLVYIRGVIHGWSSFMQAVAQCAYNTVLYCATGFWKFRTQGQGPHTCDNSIQMWLFARSRFWRSSRWKEHPHLLWVMAVYRYLPA